MAFRTLSTIHTIVIHCTATPQEREVSVQDVERWHKDRGFDSIGYHYFIDLDGHVHIGRPLEKVGAHAKGNNTQTIGICYAGGCDMHMEPKDTLNKKQHKAMSSLILALGTVLQQPLKVIGHNEISKKACPSFDVQKKFLGEQLLLQHLVC